MALVSLFLEPVPPGSTTRGKAKLAITGARRRLAVHVKRAMFALLNADQREALRAQRMGYTPIFVVGAPSSEELAAYTFVMNQIGDVLDLTI